MPHTLYAYYHTHWDREWYLPFRAYQHRLLKVVDDILDVLEADKIPCFCLDGQTVLLEDYLELRPHNRTRIETLVNAEKLSIGPWYVMPDELLVSGESLVRNLARGLQISEAFGEKTFSGYLPDTFGHSADVPMILKQFEIDSAIVWRGVRPQPSLFWWQSPSGDKVLAYHLTDGYFQNAFHMGKGDAEKKTFFEGWLKRVQAVNDETVPMLFPIGADHLGFDADSPNMLAQLAPDTSVITPDVFMANLTLPTEKTIIGELRDPEGPYLLPGTFSSRMYLKQENRKLEWRMTRQLEQLLTWCRLSNIEISFETELALLWKMLLLNHPHDSICGCSVDPVHRENECRFDQIRQFSDAMIHECHHRLMQRHQPEAGILVLNLGDTPYTGVVEVTQEYSLSGPVSEPWPDSQVISEETLLDETYRINTSVLSLSENQMLRRKSLIWCESILMHGLSVVSPMLLPDVVIVTENSLDNGYVRVQVSPAGELVAKDLKTGQFYPGLHQLWRNAEQGDSYNAAPVPGSKPEQAKLTGCEILHAGPLRGTLKVSWYFVEIDLELETFVSLDAGSPRLTFETRFTNNTADHKIQAMFACAQPITDVIAEGHFSPVTRTYDPAYRIEDAMPVPPQKELVVSSGPIQRWVGVPDQTFLTEGLAEYEVAGSTFKLTLMRAFGMLSRKDTGVRGSHAGPPLETHEGQCLNRSFICRYAWLPGFTVESANTHADLLYGAVYGFGQQIEENTLDAKTSFFSWDNPHVISSAVIPAKDHWTLRLVNPTDQPQTLKLTLPNIPPVQVVNLAGNVIETLSIPTTTIAPYAIQTLRIPLQS